MIKNDKASSYTLYYKVESPKYFHNHILREQGKFATSVYCKPTFSEIYIHFFSHCTENEVFH